MDARTEATDAELLARHAAGDGRALGELVGRHGGLVLGVARRRVGAGPDADDVTQAVFVLLARKAGAAGRSARRLGTLAPWLLATARHAARNADRRRRRRARHEREAAVRRSRFAAFASHDPSAVLIWREIAQILDDAVLALPAADRAAVVLRHFEQRPIADVAAALDVSPDAARQRVHRALVKLRGKLARRGVEVPAATLGTLLAAHATAAPPAALAAACAASAATPAALAIATGVTAMTTMKLATTATVGLALAAGTAATLTAGGTGPASTRPAAAAPTGPALGEVVEVTLHAAAAEGKPTLLDLDTGQTLPGTGDVPDRREKMDLMDVAVNHGRDTPGLNGIPLAAVPVYNRMWDDATVRDVRELWLRNPNELTRLDALGGLPRTFLFRTRQGGGGVLQITRLDDGGRAVDLRYKLLVRDAPAAPRPEPGDARNEEETRRLSTLRMAGLAAISELIEAGDYPADLAGAIDAHQPGLALPEGLVYARPTAEAQTMWPVALLPMLFDGTTTTAERPAAVGFADASARMVRDPAELNVLLARAGVVQPANAPAGAPAGPLPLGEVVTATLHNGNPDEPTFLDLDTGGTLTNNELNERPGRPAAEMDVAHFSGGPEPALGGMTLAARPVESRLWDAAGEAEARAMWQEELGQPKLAYVGELPRTFLFRTKGGAAGVLQIVRVDEWPDGERAATLRYKLLARGEAAPEPLDVPGNGLTADENRRSRAMLNAGLAIGHYRDKHGEWPARLADALAEHGEELDVPETTVYARPPEDSQWPVDQLPVLFERTSVADGPVVIATASPGAWIVNTQAELNEMLERAGVPITDPAPPAGDELTPRVIETTPPNSTQGVDPATAELRVRYTRPIDPASFSATAISDELMPEVTGEPTYDPATNTFALPVKLQPGTTYALRFGYPPNHARAADGDGRAAEPSALFFATAEAPEEPAGGLLPLGEVVTVTLHDRHPNEPTFLDLDTGGTLTINELNERPGRPDAEMDVGHFSGHREPALGGMTLAARPVENRLWDTAGEEEARAMWQEALGSPKLAYAGELPRTFLFRTEDGGAGVLQIVRLDQWPDGDRAATLRYKLLARGESVPEPLYAPDGGWTADESRRGSVMRSAALAIALYRDKHGAWPARLADALAELDGALDVPETTIYARPPDDSQWPEDHLAILFERTSVADGPVVFATAATSAYLTHTQAELNEMLERAGVPITDPAPQAGDELTPRVVETTPANRTQDVDPATSEIRVRYTRPINPATFSVSKLSDETMPEVVGEVVHDPATGTFALPVKLEPATSYALRIGYPPDTIRAAEEDGGRVAEPHFLFFATADAPAEAPAEEVEEVDPEERGAALRAWLLAVTAAAEGGAWPPTLDDARPQALAMAAEKIYEREVGIPPATPEAAVRYLDGRPVEWPQIGPDAVYLPPARGGPGDVNAPILFDATTVPEGGAVLVGFADTSVRSVDRQRALDELLRVARANAQPKEKPAEAGPGELADELFRRIAQRDDADARAAALTEVRQMLLDGPAAGRVAALRALARAADVPFDRAPLLEAARPLLDADPAVVAAAVRALPSLGATPDDARRIAALAEHSAEEVRRAVPAGMMFAAAGDGSRAVPDAVAGELNAALLTLLADDDARVVKEALRAMWGFEVSPAVEARVIELSRPPAGDGPVGPQGTYYDAIYYALSTRPLVRPPVARRLIEVMQDTRLDAHNTRSRATWGLTHHDVDPAVAEEVTAALIAELDETLAGPTRDYIKHGLQRRDTPEARAALEEHFGEEAGDAAGDGGGAAAPAGGLLPLGEVLNVTLHAGNLDEPPFFDLDTGEAVLWNELHERPGLPFAEVALGYFSGHPEPALDGLNIAARPVVNRLWDEAGEAEARAMWQESLADPKLAYVGELPRTFLFRTKNGGAGVLQILRVDRWPDGERAATLQYKLLARGEAVAEPLFAPSGGYTEDESRRTGVMMKAAMAIGDHFNDHGVWPGTLAEALAEHDEELDLPETIVYARPPADSQWPRKQLPILFEHTSVTDGQVVVAFPVPMAYAVATQRELNEMLERAGVPITDPAPPAGDELTPRVIELTPPGGTRGVDPTTRELRVRYSRPMDPATFSYAKLSDESMPEVTGEPIYDAATNTFTLPVRLEPGKIYTLRLGYPPNPARAADGDRVAEPYLFHFATTGYEGTGVE